jgi:ATPase subunit of ABC transporter with duplicated ATPase domains
VNWLIEECNDAALACAMLRDVQKWDPAVELQSFSDRWKDRHPGWDPVPAWARRVTKLEEGVGELLEEERMLQEREDADKLMGEAEEVNQEWIDDFLHVKSSEKRESARQKVLEVLRSSKLSREQEEAFEAFTHGVNRGGIFKEMWQGAPGTGKSFLLKLVCHWLKSRGIPYLITSSTGISA